MSLTLILGPMFSGKSTELIRRIRLSRHLGTTPLIITHASDTRYDRDHVITHDHDKEKAFSLSKLTGLGEMQEYAAATHIFIEEGQFFGADLISFLKIAVDIDQKHVVVATLAGDFMRRPFPHIGELVAMCDELIQLCALCMLCKDGTYAPFTMRVYHEASDQRVMLVGGAETYQSVCRKHFVTA